MHCISCLKSINDKVAIDMCKKCNRPLHWYCSGAGICPNCIPRDAKRVRRPAQSFLEENPEYNVLSIASVVQTRDMGDAKDQMEMIERQKQPNCPRCDKKVSQDVITCSKCPLVYHSFCVPYVYANSTRPSDFTCPICWNRTKNSISNESVIATVCESLAPTNDSLVPMIGQSLNCIADKIDSLPFDKSEQLTIVDRYQGIMTRSMVMNIGERRRRVIVSIQEEDMCDDDNDDNDDDNDDDDDDDDDDSDDDSDDDENDDSEDHLMDEDKVSCDASSVYSESSFGSFVSSRSSMCDSDNSFESELSEGDSQCSDVSFNDWDYYEHCDT